MRPTNFQGNVHIINFPAGTAPADLAALFDDFGLVLGAHIKTIPSTGGTLRMGIVAVAPDKAADKAIEALQGYQMGGLKLKLRKAKPLEKPTPKPRAAARPHTPKPNYASQNYPCQPYSSQSYSQNEDRPTPSSADLFPGVSYQESPRKVIVEYKKRRTLSRV